MPTRPGQIRDAVALALIIMATPLSAEAPLPSAEIYILGEVHDNPAHHVAQGDLIARIAPQAVVLEHLTDEQADRLASAIPRTADELDRVLDWSTSGWPPVEMFVPIFTAAAEAGATIAGAAGAPGDLSVFDLGSPLPEAEQAAREQLQADAHCGALPPELLPQFVARQRAKDAQFAARTLDALDRYGSPVVLVTGNGHARDDWGVPAAIRLARPDVAVVSILQGEGGNRPAGGNQIVLDAEAPAREDPCAAFR